MKSVELWRPYFGLVIVVGIVSIGLWILGPASKFLVFAFVSAYFFLPSLRWLEKFKIPRLISVGIIFAIFAGLIILALLFLVPAVGRELSSLIERAPGILDAAILRLKGLMELMDIPLSTQIQDLELWVRQHSIDIIQNIGSPILSSFKGFLGTTLSTLVAILSLFLVPVFFIFMVLDLERFLHNFEELLPHQSRKKARTFVQALDSIFSGFLRGQLLVCLFLSVSYALGLSLVGISYGWLIGIVGGAISFIPYLGATFCIVTSVIVLLASSGTLISFIGLALVISVVQGLESFVVTPRLVGNRVGLNSLASILAVIAGGNLWGFWGLFFAIPLAGFMQVVAKDLLATYKKSDLYRSS